MPQSYKDVEKLSQGGGGLSPRQITMYVLLLPLVGCPTSPTTVRAVSSVLTFNFLRI